MNTQAINREFSEFIQYRKSALKYMANDINTIKNV